MNTSIEVKACTTEDVAALSDVAIRSYRDFYLYLWNDEGSWYINRSFLPQQLDAEIRDKNAAFFQLLIDGKLIGFMKMNIDMPLTEYPHLNGIELERIYLLRTASGQGFGRQALEFCFDFARKKGKEIIWLKSMDSSEAIHFYERLGFEEVAGFMLDFELMKPEYRGMKVMMKRLIY